MSEFNLHHVLHDAVESTEDPDPAVVSEAAFEAISPSDHTEALRQALDLLLPHFIASTRPTRRSGSKGKSKTRRKRPRTSSAASTAMHRFLASKEFSPFRSAWILLADATVEDLESIAQARYTLADQTHAKGDWWARCAKQVAEAGVETFGELDESVIEELMEE
jgi:hypothetical protein